MGAPLASHRLNSLPRVDLPGPFPVGRYARKLQPDNVDVLRLLAQTSDELGYTRQAIEA